MTEPRGSSETVRSAVVGSIVFGAGWTVFVVSSLAGFVGFAQAQIATRNVLVNNTYVGRIELFNLVQNRVLNVRFHPANNDLGVINDFALNWWQAANSEDFPDIMDPINQSTNIANVPTGSPFHDNDPSYYPNNFRTPSGGVYNILFGGNNWWMQDAPGLGRNRVYWETWLVRSGGNHVERLVCFNWGISSPGGVLTNWQHPNFINDSQFNLLNTLNRSGFGGFWTVGGPVSAIPALSVWGMIVLLLVVLAIGSAVFSRKGAALAESDS